MSEILLILIIALLVIKPEKLPGVAYRLGQFFNQVQQWIQKIKTEMQGKQ